MKKIFAILMTICLTAIALSVTAFAEEAPAAGVVLRVSATEKGGWGNVKIHDYTNFEEGWEAAVTFARNEDSMKNYSCVVVDFYADWNANAEGEFGDSDGLGFRFSTICVPEDVRITLNLNGHTINRGLKVCEYDGEVMYFHENADVVINNGTISGGWSYNGGGGIHANNANVTLNNVNLVGNRTTDDDGAGIALHDDSTLIMEGGLISNNIIDGDGIPRGAGLYLDSSVAELKNVTFSGNKSRRGAAIASTCSSIITLNECVIENHNLDYGGSVSESLIYSDNLGRDTYCLNKCTIRNNTTSAGDIVQLEADDFTMNECVISGNNAFAVFEGDCGWWFSETNYYINNTQIVDNTAIIADPDAVTGYSTDCTVFVFEKCKFNNNNYGKYNDFHCYDESDMTFTDCDFGDSTFTGKEFMKFFGNNATASIFGEGSLTMIVALLALIASAVSIFITVYYNKKKAAPVAANNATEADEE